MSADRPKRAITVRDAVTYAPILHHALSPDGGSMLVVTPRFDPDTHTRRPKLAVRPVDGDPTWIDLGPPDASYHTPAWSSDGRIVAFRTWRDVSDVAILDPATPDEPGVGLLGMPPWATSLCWWGSPQRVACLGEDRDGVRRLWSWDDPTVGPRVLTPPGQRIADAAFAHPTRGLAWIHQPARAVGAADPGTELWVTRDASKRPDVVPVPEPWLGYLAWSPDGRWLVGLARPLDEPLTQPHLWILDVGTDASRPIGAPRQLLGGVDGWITGFDWRADSGGLVVAIEQGTVGRLLDTPVSGDPHRVLGPTEVVLGGPRFDRAGGRMLYLHQDGDVPQHVRLVEPGATRSTQVTPHNDRLRTAALAPQRHVSWTAPDGLSIDGLLMTPEAPRPPLLVWLHGGPAEHLQRTFSIYFQLFAARGWAVLAPNFRGSTGRDDAFLRAIVGRVGEADVGDVLSGIDALADVVDTSRVAYVGWSYGGALALACAAERPDTRAVVAGAPVIDWIGAFGARLWPWLTPRYFGGAPWEDPAPYQRASVVHRLSRVRAPTLFLHGEADDRVPVSQSRLAWRLLQAQGVTADLRLFPGEPHVLSAPWAVQELLVRTTAWLDAHGGAVR